MIGRIYAFFWEQFCAKVERQCMQGFAGICDGGDDQNRASRNAKNRASRNGAKLCKIWCEKYKELLRFLMVKLA